MNEKTIWWILPSGMGHLLKKNVFIASRAKRLKK